MVERAPDSRTGSAFGGRSGEIDSIPEPLVDLDRLSFAVRLRARLIACGAAAGLAAGVGISVLSAPLPTAFTQLIVGGPDTTRSSGEESPAAAQCHTADVAGRAAAALQMDFVELLDSYRCLARGPQVVAVEVTAPTEGEALRRAGALGPALHESRRALGTAQAAEIADAFLARRAAATLELAGVIGAASGLDTSTESAALVESRARSIGNIDLLTRADQDVQTELVVVGARIVDPPRMLPSPGLRRLGQGGLIGGFLGGGLALGAAVLASVLWPRPVRRRDVAGALGAPVVMAVRRPPPLRRHRGEASTELASAGAALARMIASTPGGVALLHIGCPGVAAALAEHVSGLPGSPELRVGALLPRPGWPAVQEFGPVVVLLVRAGHTSEATLRATARDLARAETAVLGIVLVDAHPKDHTDGLADAEYYAAMADHRAWLRSSGAAT